MNTPNPSTPGYYCLIDGRHWHGRQSGIFEGPGHFEPWEEIQPINLGKFYNVAVAPKKIPLKIGERTGDGGISFTAPFLESYTPRISEEYYDYTQHLFPGCLYFLALVGMCTSNIAPELLRVNESRPVLVKWKNRWVGIIAQFIDTNAR